MTFFDFEEIANKIRNAIVILKERQKLIRMRQKIKEERTRWDELKKTSKKI